MHLLKKYIFFIIITSVNIAIFSSCSTKVIRHTAAALDTPAHHVFSGLNLLDRGQTDDAIREFKLAIELNPKYSPAFYGLGLALGAKGDFSAAFQDMNKAKDYGQTENEKGMAYVGFMRLYTLQKGEGWLHSVEGSFKNAQYEIEDFPEAHFYMGIAFKDAYRFDDAEGEFKKVLQIKKGLINEADTQLKLVQKINRAMPGTDVGKRLALLDRITRADCAAIFVHELRLEKVYEKAGKNGEPLKTIPEDIKDHLLRTDIEAIMRIGLRGLEVFPDGSFWPDRLISRGAYAILIEDVMSTITHDPKLSVKHIGSESPYPDVKNDEPYFNAVMVCITRGLMSTEEVGDEKFNPQGTISGADALLVIRKLREELKIF